MKYGNDLNLGFIDDGSGTKLRFTREQRSNGLFVVGTPKSGKSKLFESLIWQDILLWPRHRCGVMAVDVHGALYDALVDRLAAADLKHLPVVPIDLRRNDWVVAYNLLRQRPGVDMAAVIAGFVRAIAHAWGATGVLDTPRLAKWLRVILSTLSENRLSLGDALHLIRSPEFRYQAASQVTDLVARSVWDVSARLREADFQEQVESTVSRLVKFLSTQVMRASLCQTGESLDLAAAIRRGSIILVNLATQGGQIDQEDAATFGSILLSDLWSAAQARGKREHGTAEELKPFYLYLDEFHRFVTPVMAETLDQARGFGLHIALAHQFPSQLLRGGDHGQIVYDSVLANARTKIVFQLDHPVDLPMMAMSLYRQQIDTNQVKHQHYSTKVLGHEIVYMPSTHESATEGKSVGREWSHTDTENHGIATNWNHTVGKSHEHTVGTAQSDGKTDTRARTTGASSGENSLEGDQWARNRARGKGKTGTVTETEGENFNVSARDQNPDEDFEAERGDQPGARTSRGRSTARSKGEADSANSQEGESAGGNRSRGKSKTRNDGSTDTSARSRVKTRTESDSDGVITTDTVGGTEMAGAGTADTVGGSETHSNSKTKGKTLAPVVLPVLGQEAGPPQFRSVDEQTFEWTQRIAGQAQRHCIVRLDGVPLPIPMVTATVKPAQTVARWRERWLERCLTSIPFALRMVDAIARIAAHERALLNGLSNGAIHSEARSARRRLR